jgi:HD-GYP domain-containing protein (c-di-GMP phosphodiesterase class II)
VRTLPAELLIFRDITSRRKAEAESAEMVEKLRKAMGATIQAIALTVETRDPTTAGHQRRVSDLSRTIADRLGFPADRKEALRMASSIHDLGKISIPSEILSKPGRLNETEMNLVRTHAQVGHDILSRIDFPWPIAEIVLQHHERMDGSGYPRGLRGEEISIEGRVLGVADVVEAMVSHRPYRSAHTEAEAIDEIRKNRGRFYDLAVVDVCVGLFVNREYQFIR